MKTKLLAFLLAGMVATPILADKPDWAGKGKISQEQKDAHRAKMKAKGDVEDLENGIEESKAKIKHEKKKREKHAQLQENTHKDITHKQPEQLKGVEEQKDKKFAQVQKELDKGSEKGRESRAQSKKWWKFWNE